MGRQIHHGISVHCGILREVQRASALARKTAAEVHRLQLRLLEALPPCPMGATNDLSEVHHEAVLIDSVTLMEVGEEANHFAIIPSEDMIQAAACASPTHVLGEERVVDSVRGARSAP